MIDRLECGLVELKFDAGSDDTMTFSGYGASFDNVDSYGDVIVKGAFTDTLAKAEKSGAWPAMLAQHGGMFGDDNTPIGVWTSIEEDAKGLKVAGTLAKTARGVEYYTLMKMQPRPAINGLSIGYVAKDFSLRRGPNEPRRTLKKVDLLEISLVTTPANSKARVDSVKSGLTIKNAEIALRDAGFSRSEAKEILSEGFRTVRLRDAARDPANDEVAAALARLHQSMKR
jgi:HK97 family phage prohead protease